MTFQNKIYGTGSSKNKRISNKKNLSATETPPWSYKNPAGLHISNDLK